MIDAEDNVLRFFAIDHVLVSFVTIATTGAVFSLQFTKNRLENGRGGERRGQARGGGGTEGRGKEGGKRK